MTCYICASAPRDEGCRLRELRRMGWRTRIAIVVVAAFLASGVVAGITACGG